MPKFPRLQLNVQVFALSILALVTLLTAVPVFGQEVPGGGALRGMMIPIYGVMVLAYVYFAFALQTIAKKVQADNAWWAWIPILQIILSLNIARKPVWWIVLCLIPFLNIVILIIIWMGIAEAVKKPSWWGILLIVPVLGLFVPGYLAWSD